jgi:hypothetical protein
LQQFVGLELGDFFHGQGRETALLKFPKPHIGWAFQLILVLLSIIVALVCSHLIAVSEEKANTAAYVFAAAVGGAFEIIYLYFLEHGELKKLLKEIEGRQGEISTKYDDLTKKTQQSDRNWQPTISIQLNFTKLIWLAPH